MSRIKELQAALVGVGVIQLLADIVVDTNSIARTRAAAALWSIAAVDGMVKSPKLAWVLLNLLRAVSKRYDIQGAINIAESVPKCVRLLQESNEKTKEATLRLLCCMVKSNGKNGKDLLIKAGVIPTLMDILRVRPPIKAFELIKRLTNNPKFKPLIVSAGVIDALALLTQEASSEQCWGAIETLLEI